MELIFIYWIFIWQNCPIFNNACTVGQNTQHYKNTLVHPWPFKWYHLHGQGDFKVTSKQAFLITYHHHITNYTITIYLYIYLSKSNFIIFFALRGDCLKAYIQILISVNQHNFLFFMVYNVMKMNQLLYDVMKNQKMWQLLLTSRNNYWPVTNYNDTSKSTEN